MTHDDDWEHGEIPQWLLLENLELEAKNTIAKGLVCHLDFVQDFFNVQLRDLDEEHRDKFYASLPTTLVTNDDSPQVALYKLGQCAKLLDKLNDKPLRKQHYTMGTMLKANQQLVGVLATLNLSIIRSWSDTTKVQVTDAQS